MGVKAEENDRKNIRSFCEPWHIITAFSVVSTLYMPLEAGYVVMQMRLADKR